MKYKDWDHKCKFCGAEMETIAAHEWDSGGESIFWCPNCGTTLNDIDHLYPHDQAFEWKQSKVAEAWQLIEHTQKHHNGANWANALTASAAELCQSDLKELVIKIVDFVKDYEVKNGIS